MDARAIQRTVRQSARKMRLVIDLIRGRAVPEADAILRFSKKRAAKQIRKVLKSAVANAQQAAQRDNAPFDADRLRVKYAVVNEGATLKRFAAAAMGRATPIKKRTSHVEIHVGADTAPAAPPPPAAPTAQAAAVKGGAKGEAKGAAKAKTAAKARSKARKAAGKKTKKASK
jgi:large subunit ribosomal protein L22